MRKKEWIGILLLIIAVAGFGVWEKWGREHYRTTEVIVAASDIPAGTPLSASLFAAKNVDNGAIQEGALRPAEINRITGKRAAVTIPANSQISTSLLRDADTYLEEGESVYVLKGEWISLRSSSLRRGDWVDVYAFLPREERGTDTGNASPAHANGDANADSNEGENQEVFEQLGRYRICFVKDTNESEVTATAETEKGAFETEYALERTTSTAPVYTVEIAATAEDYEKILAAVLRNEEGALDSPATTRANGAASLMLVQVIL